MLIEILMAVILIIALIVIFSLVKNFFGAIFKIIFGLLLLIILISLFIGLDFKRNGGSLEETFIFISDGSNLVKGFYYSATDFYQEMREADFLTFKNKIENEEDLGNATVAIVTDPELTYVNEESLNSSELKDILKSKDIEIIKNNWINKLNLFR